MFGLWLAWPKLLKGCVYPIKFNTIKSGYKSPGPAPFSGSLLPKSPSRVSKFCILASFGFGEWVNYLISARYIDKVNITPHSVLVFKTFVAFVAVLTKTVQLTSSSR